MSCENRPGLTVSLATLQRVPALISDPGCQCEVPSSAAEPDAAPHGEERVWLLGWGGDWWQLGRLRPRS